MAEKMVQRMLLDEVAAKLGVARTTARKWLHRDGIVGKKDDTAKYHRKVYYVPDEFFLPRTDPVDELKKQGYVTAEDIAKRGNGTSVHVTTTLRLAGIPPDLIEPFSGKYLWKDRPELDEAVELRVHRVADKNPDAPGVQIGDNVGRNYRKVVKGQGLNILQEEREKKQWIGRKGRLVIEGHVVAEGIIESVSMCGVFFKGSSSKGDLNDLELCE